jgi:hypothetical protein
MAASSTSNGNCGHAAFQLSVVCECSKMVAEVAPSWKSRYLCPSADSVFGFSRPFNHFTTLQVCQTKACWVPGQFWHLHPLHLMQEAERCHWFEGSRYFTHIILNMDCISWNRKFASCLSTVLQFHQWIHGWNPLRIHKHQGLPRSHSSKTNQDTVRRCLKGSSQSLSIKWRVSTSPQRALNRFRAFRAVLGSRESSCVSSDVKWCQVLPWFRRNF